jgi:pimeloyl-ACP methyl ester carboxylesterase
MPASRWLSRCWALVAAIFASACAGPEIPYERLEAKYAMPSSGYRMLGTGERIHYTDDGPKDAAAIVLVHGFAASSHAWRPWIERLRGSYRLIAIDLPGHGLTRTPEGYVPSMTSNADLIAELTTAIGLERFVLAGNSMGGAVSWTFALRHPDRLNGLVLVNSAGWPASDAAAAPPLVFGLLANPVGRGVLKAFDPRLLAGGALRAAYIDETLVDKALIDRYAELALAVGHRDVLLGGRSGPGSGVTRDTFASIRVPTLVMGGAEDRIIPVEQQRELAKAIPGAVYVEYPQGGHVPMEQLPDVTATDLTAFLASLPLDGGDIQSAR